ncbi:hypothetical protein MBLNU230_g3445t1 [Neophaeotheca triangularis]
MSVDNGTLKDLLATLDALEGTSVDSDDRRMDVVQDSSQSTTIPSSLPAVFDSLEQAQGVLYDLIGSSHRLRVTFVQAARQTLAHTHYANAEQAVQLCACYSLSRRMNLNSEFWRRKGQLLEGLAGWSAPLDSIAWTLPAEHYPWLLSMQIQPFFSETSVKCFHITRERNDDQLETLFCSVLDKIGKYLFSRINRLLELQRGRDRNTQPTTFKPGGGSP